MVAVIDSDFDVRNHIPINKDPVKYSKNLKSYHKKLWSKPLPNGTEFSLEEKGYLYHRPQFAEFHLDSDAITPSYKTAKSLSEIVAQVPEVAVNYSFMALKFQHIPFPRREK